MSKLIEGTKVKVVAGDRDTVLFDPYGTVTNLKENGDCEIHLKSNTYFRSNLKEIGEGKDIIPYNWE